MMAFRQQPAGCAARWVGLVDDDGAGGLKMIVRLVSLFARGDSVERSGGGGGKGLAASVVPL